MRAPWFPPALTSFWMVGCAASGVPLVVVVRAAASAPRVCCRHDEAPEPLHYGRWFRGFPLRLFGRVSYMSRSAAVPSLVGMTLTSAHHSLILRTLVTVIFTAVLSPSLARFAYPALSLACSHCITSWGGWRATFLVLCGVALYANGGHAW